MTQTEAGGELSAQRPLTVAGAPVAQKRLRLDSIDSLRALAAMAVVMVHVFEIYGLGLSDVGDGRGGLTDSLPHQIIGLLFDWVFHLGGLAVPVFIALSGYSLMIPIVRSPQSLRSPGQVGNFFYRRLRRIVPPYYAALFLALLVIWLVPGMATPANVYWDRALLDLNGANIITHLLLVHNLDPIWANSINPPLWSMAVEWQIYFLFPLLVIIWRRLGLVTMLGVAAVYSGVLLYTPVRLLPLSHGSFVLLFTMGMAAAAVSFATGGMAKWLHDRLPWGLFAAAAFLAFLGLHVLRVLTGSDDGGLILELTVTVATMALVIAGTKRQLLHRESAVDRALSHPTLTRIGAFSYSLYLVHMPLLAMLALLARTVGLSVTLSYLLVILAGLPLSLLAGYGFHLIFERPFMTAPGAAQAAKVAKAAEANAS